MTTATIETVELDWAKPILERFAPRPTVAMSSPSRPRGVYAETYPGRPTVLILYTTGRSPEDQMRDLVGQLARLRLSARGSSIASLASETAFLEHELALDHSEAGAGGCALSGKACLNGLERRFSSGQVVRITVDGMDREGVVGAVAERSATVLDRETLRPLGEFGFRELSARNLSAPVSAAPREARRRVLKNPCPATGNTSAHRWEVVPGTESAPTWSANGKAVYNTRDQVCKACGLEEKGVRWSKTVSA